MLSNLLIFSVALFGLFLLWKVHHLRRLGALTHCITCGYCLHALTSPRCPECGTSLAANAVAISKRLRSLRYKRYSPVAVVLIVPALLVAASITHRALSTANWYIYAPSWYLVYALRTSSGDSAELAARQINSRWPTLSSTQRSEVLDVCLDYQAKRAPVPRTLMSILGTAFDAHALTAAQRDRFLAQDVNIAIDSLDPRFHAGNWIGHRWAYECTCPTKTITAVHVVKDIQLDGHPVDEDPRALGVSSGMIGPCSTAWGVAPPAPIGHHTIQITIEISLYDGTPRPTMIWGPNLARNPPHLDLPPTPPAFTKTVVFTHTFEVIPRATSPVSPALTARTPTPHPR